MSHENNLDEKEIRTKGWRHYTNGLIAAELSRFTLYYDRVVQWLPRSEDEGLILRLLKAREKFVVHEEEFDLDLKDERAKRTAVLLNGTINHHHDIQRLLTRLRGRLARTSRVVLIAYNPYLGWLYRLTHALGVRKGEVPSTFVTREDLRNIAKLAGYEMIRVRPVAYFPWKFLGIGDVLNQILPAIPVLRWSSLASVVILRPIVNEGSRKPSLSCVVPARNERGTIENVIKGIPNLGCSLEIIFVEGHSTDGTWEEIQRVSREYGAKFKIVAFQQEGKGKADAVRLGFSKATGELITILDADLAVSPEMLGRFYEAYCEGHGDFINGSRLIYPMEEQAMRFLNRLGNVFFAKALSWELDTHLSDSLCGTKLLTKHDYERMESWRANFGNFDPFGDFELIFPAAILGLGIVDVPIRYRSRTYGITNISRFSHGLMLFRMMLIAFFRFRMGSRYGRY